MQDRNRREAETWRLRHRRGRSGCGGRRGGTHCRRAGAPTGALPEAPRTPSSSGSPSSSRPAAPPAAPSASPSPPTPLLASAAAAESALGGPGAVAPRPAGATTSRAQRARPLPSPPGPTRCLAGEFRVAVLRGAAASMTATRCGSPRSCPLQLASAHRGRTRRSTWLRRFDRILVGGQATSVEPARPSCVRLGLNVTRTYGSAEEPAAAA